MAQKNNKGFSLIEIVIAIAVLTLLLTPIIKQFAQTMRVSRQAKEQQYVNEEATYALEDAQVASKEELVAKYSQIVTDNPSYTFSTSTNSIECELYDETGSLYDIVDHNGNPYKDSHDNDINKLIYKVDTYTLGNMKIGPKNTLYNEVVTVDDLATKVRGAKKVGMGGKGFTIKYDVAPGSVPDGFSMTSEGAVVKLDENGNVIGVVVDEIDYVGNPNNINLGHMQNLDYETVAMINGTASNFDEQAREALFSVAMDVLKDKAYDKWELGMLHSGNESVFNQYEYVPTMVKATKIYVEKLTDLSGKDYFQVKADVYYYCTFKIEDVSPDAPITLSYNVYAQNFYTNQCPDIYFEYQPFVRNMEPDGSSYDITYAENDYIIVDNYVEGAKLYLYKPYKDAINVAASATDALYDRKDDYTYTVTEIDESDYSTPAEYEQALMDNTVSIHVAKANSTNKFMNIFTNLNVDFDGRGDKSQFKVSESVFTNFTHVKSDKASATGSFVDYDTEYIKSIASDVRYDERLKTVTVTLIPVNDKGSNTVRFTGAKGEK